MEPRELWDRNSVLAEAFCASDEQVRQAQAVLDEAQAERSRTLAAFAVTVGNDGAVADLMGLNEREVRLARRTVGKTNARSVAEELLDRFPQASTQPIPQAQPATPAAPPPPPVEEPFTDQTSHVSPQAQPPQANQTSQAYHHHQTGHGVPGEVHVPHPRTESSPLQEMAHQDSASSGLHMSEAEGNPVVWSSSMDSVLLWSWQSGLDLQTVAGELGLDVRALLLRVQALADGGMLTPTSSQTTEANRSGRHRRHYEEGYASLFTPTATFPTQVHY
ncbi:hypothetical protein GCM10011583_74670 [Streptomyces camponoticapitis]|uniref:ANTAR domain-containing protein n=1 Tax=Streptomyces camponoticapitis TaxID=1616125 RepID=A0ABQ2EXZ7_9ACTN|nr:hypothetical protein [Streptomyces camponoticapitis]GGK31940.1 hypothetical protein GCM10011583_74670 [Streptomyces camponoticapitis]